MFILLTLVHVVVCVFLIIVVLLQSGKAADLAGAFGGMGSQTAFGPRGSATLLSKATTISAVLFMITSLGLSIMATRASSGTSLGNTVLEKSGAAQTAPANKGTQRAPAVPPGQPSVTYEQGGEKKTVPLNIPNTPAQPAPAPANKK